MSDGTREGFAGEIRAALGQLNNNDIPVAVLVARLRLENERLRGQLEEALKPRIHGDALITYIIQNRLIHAVDKEVIVWAANAPEILEAIVNGIQIKELKEQASRIISAVKEELL